MHEPERTPKEIPPCLYILKELVLGRVQPLEICYFWQILWLIVWIILQPPLKEESDEHKSPGEDKKEPKPDVVINMPLLEIHTVGGVLVNMPHVITLWSGVSVVESWCTSQPLSSSPPMPPSGLTATLE